jgi:N-acetyltransferase
MPQAPLAPVTLAGRYVRLEPLSSEHIDALADVGLDPDLWRWTTSQITSRDEMADYVQAALAGQAAGSVLPFVTVEQSSGRLIGSTRYGNIDMANRRVEIGWTWVARPWQRTAVNTEAKYLMLRHAFETLGCLRVELKTDVLNERSRRAIGRIGGREEGILRKHVITQSGRVRDTVYFSIIDDEWPQAKAALEARLG